MIFNRTILTLYLLSIYLFSVAQISSSETRSQKDFQKNKIVSNINIGLIGLSSLNDSIPKNESKSLEPLKNKFSSLLQQQVEKTTSKPLSDLKKILKEDADRYFKSPIQLKNAEVNYESFFDSTYWIAEGRSYYYSNLTLYSSWIVAGIPVQFGVQNQAGIQHNDLYQNNFSVRFDKDAYIDQLKKNVAGKYDPATLLNGLKNPIEGLKDQSQKLLKDDLEKLNSSYKGILENDISGITNNQSLLFNSDIKSLKEKLVNADLISRARNNEALLTSLQQKANLGEKVNAEDLKALEASVMRLKAVQELVAKVEEHKNKWESSGLLKKIKQFDVFKANRLSQLMNDPNVIRRQAREFLSLKGLQRFFLNVNKLNIGQEGLSLSPLTFQNFLQNGLSTQFPNKKGNPLSLLVGRQKDLNSITDLGFTDNLFSNNSNVKAVSLGLGSTKVSSSAVSISSFNQSMNNGSALPYLTNEFRKILVTTLSNQLTIGANGHIDIDLSRSATSYQESGLGGDSTLTPKSNLSRILNSDNLMANTALYLKYSDEFPDQGLAYQVSFNKVANGYDNPGNTFLSGGSTEIGGQVRQAFYKKKLLASVRGNMRNYKFNDEIDESWRNLYFVMDAKWKMKKGQFIGIRYQPNRMTRNEDGRSFNVSKIDRLSVESNLYKKLGRQGYRNYVTLTYQNNEYLMTANNLVSSTSMQLNSSQSLTVGKNIFYANLFLVSSSNKSGYVYFNSSVNADAGITYQLTKRIMATSGVVYGNVDAWYRQVGVRQSINGELNERFIVSVYVDARKNIKEYLPSWNEPVRADISIRYVFRQ
jgi:hypothetical protein